MKRSAELSPLSRDHHQALFVALKLRQADDASGTADAVDGFLEFWRGHGERHFQIEEEVLLPCFVDGGGDPRNALVARILTDHVEIRSRARRIIARSSLEDLHELGDRLSAHVRVEEDELFPLIERTLSADALVVLGEEITRAERSG
jgi:hemerythrin-like domain-containing protein